MEDGGLVLLSACGYEQIRNRHPMLRLPGEFALCRLSSRDRLSVDPQLMEGRELGVELLVRPR